MTPGDDGAGRPSGLSRRQLLAGIGGVGAVGMASGLGTGAYLADRETFANNTLGTGEVGLTVDGDPTNGTVTVGPFAVDRTTFEARPKPKKFEIEASANPVRVWLATRCPDGDPLGDALEVEVAVDGESVTNGYRPLAEVERLLATGRRIDAGCLGLDDGPIVVEVAPYLPADSPDVGGEATELTFRLYAEQCRHVSEAEANAPGTNPFAEVVCEETCVPCEDENDVKVGSLTLRYLGDETLDPLIVRAAGSGGGGNGRGNGNNPPTTIFDATVQPNQEFALDGADSGTNTPGWIGPNIYLDSGGESRNKGTETNIHTSCSDPLGPGDVYGDFEVVAVTTTDGKLVCESGTGGDRGDDTLDDRETDPETDPECVVCDKGNNVSLATLDVRYLGAADATVSVVSAKGNTSGELFAGTVSRGDVFTLNGKDVDRSGKGTDKLGPEVEISIEGEQRPVAIHVSCSQLLAVGDVYGDFEIDGGTTTGGEPLCGSEAN